MDICLLQDLSGKRSKVELMIALSEFLKRRDGISDNDFDKLMVNNNSERLQHEELFRKSITKPYIGNGKSLNSTGPGQTGRTFPITLMPDHQEAV